MLFFNNITHLHTSKGIVGDTSLFTKFQLIFDVQQSIVYVFAKTKRKKALIYSFFLGY